jgi:transposase
MPKVLRVTFAVAADELRELEKRERRPAVRCRLALVRLVLGGIAASKAGPLLGLHPSRACDWVKRFNASGAKGLVDLPKRSRRSRLRPELVESFKARVRKGATAEDGVNVLRGKDFQRILRDEFQASCSLPGTYLILHRLGFSSLVPRPQHPESNAAAQEEFKKTACTA